MADSVAFGGRFYSRRKPAVPRRGGPPPGLGSLDYDQADTAGGESITITGVNLLGASLCTVGLTSASITANTLTQLTFTMPAKTAGTYDVQITTSGGLSNILSIEAWSPASATSVTPIHRYRADQGITLTLDKVSQINDLIGSMHQEQANPSYQPTVVNDVEYGGQPVLNSGGDIYFVHTATAPAIASPMTAYVIGDVGTSSYSSLFSIAAAAPYDLLWGDTTGGYIQFFVGSSINVDVTGGSAQPMAILLTDSGSGGSAFQMYVNDFNSPGATSTTLWSSTTYIDIGAGGAGVPNNKGRIAEIVLFSGELSEADRRRLAKYSNLRYGFSVTPPP